MKKLLLHIALFFSPPSFIQAQNLLFNNGFEEFNNCTEYHMDCSPEAWFNIPAENVLVSGRVAPDAVLGHNILVVPLDHIKQYRKQIVYTFLGCPLQPNIKYNLVFFLYTGKTPFKKLDIGFTEDEPEPDSAAAWPVSTRLSITENDVVADFRGGWKVVDVVFRPKGGERFMLMGNLTGTHEAYRSTDAMNKKGDILCFIDEVVLKPIQFNDPCTGYAENKKLAYRQNDRHTEGARVLKQNLPGTESIRWLTDTLVMSSVYFDVNQSRIRKKGLQYLDSLVYSLAGKKIGLLQVIGHTDNTGNDILNDTLSRNRAVAVSGYLAPRLGLIDAQVKSEGRGASVPVADNKSPAGREKNRRVELIVSYLAEKK